MDYARSMGVKIFHAPISFKPDASDNPNRGLGILAGCAADSLFTENTWASAFDVAMQPAPTDVVIRGKKGLDTFPGTDLEARLKANRIETLALAGFLTNCCVESTMRTAYEKGFNVVTLTDATATTSPEGQAVTAGSFGMFSKPMTVEEFSQHIAASPVPQAAAAQSHLPGPSGAAGKARTGRSGIWKDPEGEVEEFSHAASSEALVLAASQRAFASGASTSAPSPEPTYAERSSPANKARTGRSGIWASQPDSDPRLHQ